MVPATGALAVRVVYPPRGATISVAGDSTFIFGSVGNGSATLSINGDRVQVHPNGSFLAYLPVPRETQSYVLEAAIGDSRERIEHTVRIPPRGPSLANDAPLSADPSSVRPVAGQWPATERLTVAVRTNANATVVLELADSSRLPLVSARETTRDSTLWQRVVTAEYLTAPARLIIVRSTDSLTLPVPAQQRLDSLGAPRIARLIATTAVPDTDQVIAARPVPNGTYKWLLLPGTIVEVTGRVGNQARIRLDSQQEAYVDSTNVVSFGDGSIVPRRVVGNPRVVSGGDGEWADVVLPMAAAAPFLVDMRQRTLALTLYGTTLDIDIAALRSDSAIVRNVTWTPLASDRGEVAIHLAADPFGYHVRWQPGALVVRVRRPPVVNAARPLQGLTIAVDPGHPPIGATGPTGLYEGDAVLPIAERLRDELTARGARVVLTRTTLAAVPLADRPVIARRANAHAFVSIHLNALPDGVNPFNAHGTGTYFFHPQSLELAREVQAGMVRQMRLRDLGVYYDNLAVVRPTWMPSVLCEGAFVIIPEQEAWLRTPEFQQAYARGVAEGLEGYFRRLSPSGL
jgi:N-acetylmuramoyl-L-alanine amidase